MPLLISKPKIIAAAGNKKKIIREFAGRASTRTSETSIAHMKSPAGWKEPGQRPEFDEYTVVLKGALRVETEKKTMKVKAGQALIAWSGEWVRYSSPWKGGAEYIAVCLPAFSPSIVNRDLL